MKRDELAAVVNGARCTVRGWEDARYDGERDVVAAVARAFNNTESFVLCEPSLARKSRQPPDVVLIDVEVGVHVIEVKGVSLGHVKEVKGGGWFHIRYGSGPKVVNPIKQARDAMFHIREATQDLLGCASGEVRVRFGHWVALPRISRAQWTGEHAFCPPKLLFAEDLEPARLAERFGATPREGSNRPIEMCPLDQLRCVWRAFGDTSVLYASPEDRPPRGARGGGANAGAAATPAGTLGERFDALAEEDKRLSPEQQGLSVEDWSGGPRLVRGVAGSGKTIVLANNLARRVARAVRDAAGEDENEGKAHADPAPPPRPLPTPARLPRLLAVCFNRTLAPYLREKVRLAYRQRTGEDPPPRAVEVKSYNTLMYDLSRQRLWDYQKVTKDEDEQAARARAAEYLRQLEQAKGADPARVDALAYDAIYVDEGQDFYDEDFRLLLALCRTPEGREADEGPGKLPKGAEESKKAEPDLYVLYDDAQNLYGRDRPNWSALGLNVRGGRSHVMRRCYRNTRPIAEAALNVLYGTCADGRAKAPTKEFGNLNDLERAGLVVSEDGFYRVRFAPRGGPVPLVHVTSDPRAEADLLVARLRWLIAEQGVRPQDVMVLTHTNRRAEELAAAIRSARLPGTTVHLAARDKDQRLGQPGRLSVSTVHSAKGYDAYCVLLASADDFALDVKGRTAFYVGCTRAVEHLEVLAGEGKGLAAEMQRVVARIEGI